MANLIHHFETFTEKSLERVTQIPRQMSEFGKVAVLSGGRSSERDISKQSGQNILAALIRCGVDAHGVDPDEHVAQKLIEGKFSRAFVALHGKEGEDGVIQGLLQMLGIPFTGSTVAASALAMDKARAKLVMHGLRIPTPSFGMAKTAAQAEAIAQKIGFPVCVKPVAEGSSIGVTRVTHASELNSAFVKAASYGDVIIEKWIEGKNLTVAIVNETMLPSIEIRTQSEFYDFNAKYESEETQYICPAPLSMSKERSLRDLAYRAFCALGCKGWGRVDFMQDGDGKFWVLEVNTIPGMTSHSLVPMAAKAAGMDFDQLVLKILETTLVEVLPEKIVGIST
ncbi:MAG: D-alanine--D-alanine ligase [Candidatus Berkiella sp.]